MAVDGVLPLKIEGGGSCWIGGCWKHIILILRIYCYSLQGNGRRVEYLTLLGTSGFELGVITSGGPL